MRDRTPKLDRAFSAAPWLHNLPPDLIEALKAAAKVRTILAGCRLSEIGDVPDFLVGVESGVMALHTDNEEQLDIIGHIFAPGDWSRGRGDPGRHTAVHRQFRPDRRASRAGVAAGD